MRHIEQNGYHVIDWPERSELSIYELWRQFPDLVVGRYLVNTSFDSGFYMLSDSERDDGWKMVGQFAHSPMIQNLEQVPHNQFDEWLVFDHPPHVEHFESMVNYYGFTPIDFDWQEKRDLFWEQLVRFKPLHVLGENDRVYVVSHDLELVGRILGADV